jgi:hypothetical protein
MNATYIIESTKKDLGGFFVMIVNTKTKAATEIFFSDNIDLDDVHTYLAKINKIAA